MALSSRSLLILAASAALLSSACVIRIGPADDDADWSVPDETSSSSVAPGGGGDGGGEAAGGDNTTSSGGAAQQGSGGSGGGASSSSGAGGDDPYCIDAADDIGQTAAVCDSFAVAPSTSGYCEYQEPLGYLACQRAFELFAPGHAENLASCVSGIQTWQACMETPVEACVQQMYADACTNSTVVDACDTWGSICQDGGESLDVGLCKSQLNPFGDDGLYEMVSCMNAIDAPCQLRYDVCLDQVLTLE